MTDQQQFDFSGSLLDIVNYALSLDIEGRVSILDEHGRRGALLFVDRRLRQLWLENMSGEDAFKALADCTAIQCSTNVREHVEEVPLDFDFESVRKSIETGEVVRPEAPPPARPKLVEVPRGEAPSEPVGVADTLSPVAAPVPEKSGQTKIIAIAAAVAVAVVAVVVIVMQGKSPEPAAQQAQSAAQPAVVAPPAPVETPVAAEGKIAMRSAVNFSHDIAGLSLKIISLAPEGSQVKKGGLLVELDQGAIESQIKSAKMSLDKAQNELKQANAKLLADRNQFQDAIKTLENSVSSSTARQSESANPAEIKQARTALEKANTELQKAKKDLALAKDMFKKSLVSASEVDQANEKLSLAQNGYNEARSGYDKLSGAGSSSSSNDNKGNRGEMLEQLKNRAQDAEKRDQAAVQAAQSAVRSVENQMRAAGSQLKKTKIYSTLAGLVRHGEKGGKPVKVGDAVRSGQPLIAVSEAERMVVSVKISREDAGKVRLDQNVKLDFPEVSGLSIPGKVNNLSVQGEGKGYLVEIILNGTDARLRNGMAVRATIGG